MHKQAPFRSSLLLTQVFLIASLPLIQSHGLLTDPRQRGAFVVQNRLVETINSSAPFDSAAHFPAGDKSIDRGAGKKSVIRHANNNWTPYEPLNPSFHFRAGVCGDEPGKVEEHLKGGQYYYPEDDPIRARTYTQGEVVSFESNIVTHHNGFIEFFICNIDQCGDDISKRCFREGHCQPLLRAPSYCDNGNSIECGPIDPAYPGRWYLPCGPFPKGQILYGGNKRSMMYQLPENLVCDHCVIQWYWTGANTCNPPGVVEYFDGEHGPNWPDCLGQGGAVGGVTRVQRLCEGERFSEEYWQCADVRIVPRGGNEESESEEDDSSDDNEDEEEDSSDSPGSLIPNGVGGLLNSQSAQNTGSLLQGNLNRPNPSGDAESAPTENGNNGILPAPGTVSGVGAMGGEIESLDLRNGADEGEETAPEGEAVGDGDDGNEERNDGDGESGGMGGVMDNFPGKKRGRANGFTGLAGGSEDS